MLSTIKPFIWVLKVDLEALLLWKAWSIAKNFYYNFHFAQGTLKYYTIIESSVIPASIAQKTLKTVKIIEKLKNKIIWERWCMFRQGKSS